MLGTIAVSEPSGPMAARVRCALIAGFRSRLIPVLRPLGYRTRGGHWVRNLGEITHVIELQSGVYGGRATVNLAVDLPWLASPLRWVQRPALGPQAHESTRWLRLGLTLPNPSDQWWTFEADSAFVAAGAMADAVIEFGLGWLADASLRSVFLEHARVRRARSQSPRYPEGRYEPLRLLAAVCAWNGLHAEAVLLAAQAGQSWPTERARLGRARDHYARIYPDRILEPIPDLQEELERLIDSQRASSSLQ